MTSPSKLLPIIFALIILFTIPLSFLANSNFSNFSIIKTFSKYFASFHEYPLSLPELSQTFQSRAISFDASKCFPANLPSNPITFNNCCPSIPSPFKFKDFNFEDYASSNSRIRVRKAFHLVDEEFIAKFEKGIALMKALPNDDPRSFYQQAKIHCAYCNGAYHQQYPFENLKLDIHFSWLFYPFHRWYIYFFERILGNLIGDPNFALPFWNWDSIEAMQIPPSFTYLNSSLYHKLRDNNHMPPNVVDFDYNRIDKFVSREKQTSFNLGTMYKNMVLASTKELFMGSPFRLGEESHFSGVGSIENAPHNTLHTWVGASNSPHREDMGVFYTAARDPIFFPHHANIDRIWAIWKNLGQGRKDYSDDLDWLDSSFFFYDENANLVRVKIRDCLDTKKLGYVYQDVEMPWLNFQPTSKKVSKELREAKRAKVLSSKEKNFFPLVLDSIKSFIVKRPNKLRSIVEKEKEEEVLVIEGIEFESDKSIKFDVHIYDDEDELSGPNEIEFVGSFVSLPHLHKGKINTCFKLGISKVLENLESDEDDDLVVTLVPKVGKCEVVIRNIKIEFLAKY